MLGYEVTRRYGGSGLPDDTIPFTSRARPDRASARSCRAGITLTLDGRRERLLGQGALGRQADRLSAARRRRFAAEENVIIGNVALYGATSGEAYVRGVAGERFAVRNSGAHAVVEGVGDHGCEYMTGGVVVVLGRTGRNFAAGMSGGVGVRARSRRAISRTRCNREMVDLEPLDDADDVELVRDLIVSARRATPAASHAAAILDDVGEHAAPPFVKVMPRDYKRVLQQQAAAPSGTGARRAAAGGGRG